MNVSLVYTPVSTSIESISGVWRGDITMEGADTASALAYVLAIRPDCSTGGWCADERRFGEIPFDADNRYLDRTDWSNAICFGFSGGKSIEWHWACLSPREEGILAYRGADPYFQMSGVLQRQMSVPVESLAGVWHGTVTTGGEGAASSIKEKIFEIKRTCQTGKPCLNMVPEPVPNKTDIPFDATDEHGAHCFTLYIQGAGVKYQEFTACFSSQSDGTLLYWGSGPLWGEQGVLSKVGG